MDDEKLTIPPRMESLIVSGFVAILSGGLVAFNIKPYFSTTVDPWFLLLLSCVAFLVNCKDYVILSDGIVCRYFFIPYRKRKWSDISDVVYLNEWKELGEIKREHILLITLKPCRSYDAKLYTLSSYRFHFPRKVIFIHLPKENVDSIARVFQDRLEDGVFRDMRK